MAQKDVDKSSSDYQGGYKSGYVSEDRNFIDDFFHSLPPRSDDYRAGEAEGERDRFRDDHQKK